MRNVVGSCAARVTVVGTHVVRSACGSPCPWRAFWCGCGCDACGDGSNRYFHAMPGEGSTSKARGDGGGGAGPRVVLARPRVAKGHMPQSLAGELLPAVRWSQPVQGGGG